MKQPKYAALFLAATLAFGGIAPSTIVNAETSEDVTAPDAPVLSAPYHTSTSLTITGEVAAKAEILINGKTYIRTILEGGEAVFKMSPQSVGKVIDVRLVDASGNISETTRAIVAEDPEARPDAPVIKPLTETSREVRVVGEPGQYVELSIGSSTYKGKFDANGLYRRGVAPQPAYSWLSAKTITTKGATSDVSKRSVYKDRIAPKTATLTQSVTAASYGVFGKAEPFATAIVKIGTKSYTAPVMSTGKFIVKIPRQAMGQKMSLVIRDGAGNVSRSKAITVQHALYNNFHRVYMEGTKMTLHKEVFYADTTTKYADTFVPLFVGHPSKSGLGFLLSSYTEDGSVAGFEKLTLRVGRATYSQNIDEYDVYYEEYEDGSIEESYLFEPDAKLISFIDKYVRPENRITVMVQGTDYDLEFNLSGAEKRAFIQSLQYAGY